MLEAVVRAEIAKPSPRCALSTLCSIAQALDISVTDHRVLGRSTVIGTRRDESKADRETQWKEALMALREGSQDAEQECLSMVSDRLAALPTRDSQRVAV